jgi:release factor glutamine methyltransferase
MDKEQAWLLAEKYQGEKSAAFFADCKRLALGEPLGYLIGHVPFLDCTITLESRPLIPRPETEFWCEKAIAEINDYQSATDDLGLTTSLPVKVMDLCAGSGCIGVAVLKHTTNTVVHFSEIEAKQLPTIKQNLTGNEIDTDRAEIKQSNLFSAFPDEKYHFILANPPYIDSTLHRVDSSVEDFEPHLALFGGHGGMEIIVQLIVEAKYHLVPDGRVWIEHEPEQSKEIAIVASAHGFTTETHTDQYESERYSILMLQ